MEQVSQVATTMPEGGSINLYAFTFVLVLMLAGAVLHWIKLRNTGRTTSSITAYIFTDNPGASAKAGGSIFAMAAIAAGTGVADWIDPVMLWTIARETHTMPSICFFGIGGALAFGYMADSGVNSTVPKADASMPAPPAEEAKP